MMTTDTPPGAAGGTHMISLSTAYGHLVDCAEVPDAEFAGTLRRFYIEAVECSGAVVVIDGTMHTRNSFLEFVREFNDCAERSRRYG